MKKALSVLLFISVVLTLIFVSCKKDYTCKCIFKDSSGVVDSSMSTSITIHTTKRKAENGCSMTITTSDYTETCEIE